MRKTLLMSAALLGAAMALPAYAQTNGAAMGGTGTAGGNMSATMPQGSQGGGQGSQGMGGGNQAANAPANAGTAQGGMNNAGTNNGETNGTAMNNGGTSGAGTMGTPATGTMGTAAGGMQNEGTQNEATQNEATQSGTNAGGQQATVTHHRATRTHRARMAMNPETGARPGHEPGVGQSEPMAHHPSNILPSDTHSVIAPALPVPPVGQNASAETFLHVAHNAIRARRGGEAQEALERAETALLNNPTDPQRAGQVDNGPRVDHIRAALDALARRDFRTAEQNIAIAEQGAGNMGSSSYGMQGGAATGGGQEGYAAMPGAGGTSGNFAGAPSTEGATGPSQYYPNGVATNRGNSFGRGMVNGSQLPNGLNTPASGPGSNSGGGGAH